MARDTQYDDAMRGPPSSPPPPTRSGKRKAAPKKKYSFAPSGTGLSAKAMKREDDPRIQMPPSEKVSEADRPSEKMKARQDTKQEQTSLAEALTNAAAVTSPGTGPLSRAFKAGLSGAAAGATLGEALAKIQQEKIARKIESQNAAPPPDGLGAEAMAKDAPKEKRRKKDAERDAY